MFLFSSIVISKYKVIAYYLHVVFGLPEVRISIQKVYVAWQQKLWENGRLRIKYRYYMYNIYNTYPRRRDQYVRLRTHLNDLVPL